MLLTSVVDLQLGNLHRHTQRQQYARDMAQQRFLPQIEEDLEGGERSGVQGTPTFFINGVMYRGYWEHEALLAALQTAA